ncbi:MAG: helix-turn-helix domain-containing protein, partial [Flavobacteriales bacterium]
VPIPVPSLRERKGDIHLLFRWFAQEAASRYKAPPITLTEDASHVLMNYRWPGNVRQLRNLVEQLSVIEKEREIDATTLISYLPKENTSLIPTNHSGNGSSTEAINERELIFKFLFDMKTDLNALKEQVRSLGGGNSRAPQPTPNSYQEKLLLGHGTESGMSIRMQDEVDEDIDHTEVEESLSLEEKEKELVRKALDRHRGKRKKAAQELGISERTLYRKIKEWDLT